MGSALKQCSTSDGKGLEPPCPAPLSPSHTPTVGQRGQPGAETAPYRKGPPFPSLSPRCACTHLPCRTAETSCPQCSGPVSSILLLFLLPFSQMGAGGAAEGLSFPWARSPVEPCPLSAWGCTEHGGAAHTPAGQGLALPSTANCVPHFAATQLQGFTPQSPSGGKMRCRGQLPHSCLTSCWAQLCRGRKNFFESPGYRELQLWGSLVHGGGHAPFVHALRSAAGLPAWESNHP